MSGVVFAISIPTEEQEATVLEKLSVKFSENERKMQEDKLRKTSPIRHSMKKALERILKDMKVLDASWTTCSSGKFHQIVFPIKSRNKCETILEALKTNQIGRKFSSVVTVLPSSICYHADEEKEEDDDDVAINTDKNVEQVQMKNTAWNRFVSSVRARLVVAQVAESIKANAMFTFDFVCLLAIASILCAIGLVENSTMYLLSSMLISPMMRPVMAGTFGTVIGDSRLKKIGVQNEIIGLGIATLIGFCYGAVICMFTDKYGESGWPTYEMTSRGEIHGLWVGCLVAFLSGAAVALGILSDNLASLVGVAISTSLMPPAVNAGLLWSLTAVYYWKGNQDERYSSLSSASFYSNDKAVELSLEGAVSMCLTFINIVFIYLAGILIFKIKEVAPITSRDQAKKAFWNYDIKIARGYNKTLQGEEAKGMSEQFTKELSGHLNDPETLAKEIQGHYQRHSVDFMREEKILKTQYTWSPCTYCPAMKEFDRYFTGGRQNKVIRFGVDERPRRKLSSLFSPARQGDGGELENTPCSSCCSNSPAVIPKKKFVVTPCQIHEGEEC